MKYLAKILPTYFKVGNIGDEVPLISEHQIYGDRLGTVEILPDNMAYIHATDLTIGTKLSAGAFVNGSIHDVREVSVTKSPRYPECEIVEVFDD